MLDDIKPVRKGLSFFTAAGIVLASMIAATIGAGVMYLVVSLVFGR